MEGEVHIVKGRENSFVLEIKKAALANVNIPILQGKKRGLCKTVESDKGNFSLLTGMITANLGLSVWSHLILQQRGFHPKIIISYSAHSYSGKETFNTFQGSALAHGTMGRFSGLAINILFLDFSFVTA